jgi:hypothetical protein
MNLTQCIKSILLRQGLACLALATGSATLSSAAVTWHDAQFGGFISQGFMDSTNNNFPIDTKGGTFDFREEALNASATFGTHLRVSAQVYAEKVGKYGDDKPILDWFIVDYNFCPEFGLKAGRLKYPRSLYSDVLDVDVVRPFILLPQSMYDVRLRDYQASFDGAMAYGSVSIGSNSFDYKIFYGNIPLKTNSGVGDFFNSGDAFAKPPGLTSIRMDSVRGAALTWNTPVAGLRFGLTYSYSTNVAARGQIAGAPSLPELINLTTSEYEGVSAEYTRGPWTFTGEYLNNPCKIDVILPSYISPPIHAKTGIKNYYVSVARRLGKKYEVGTYYTETKNSYPTPGAGPANYRRDWTNAVRYDYNDHLLFKLEVHAIDGTMAFFNVSGISNPPGSLKSSMMLFVAKTTLSF